MGHVCNKPHLLLVDNSVIVSVIPTKNNHRQGMRQIEKYDGICWITID
jgi:hypothetical protein